MLKGFHIDEKNTISSLAFADDLLLADTHEKAQTLLTHTENYLESLGMRIAANKCASFEIRKTKDSWYVEETCLRLGNNECIPSSAVDGTILYLGGHLSPWNGLQSSNIRGNLEITLQRLRSASLKPRQKLNLPITYIIPTTFISQPSQLPPFPQIAAWTLFLGSTLRKSSISRRPLLIVYSTAVSGRGTWSSQTGNHIRNRNIKTRHRTNEYVGPISG